MSLLHLSGETKSSCESAGFRFPSPSCFRDWTGLHPDLLAFALTKLCLFSDWLRFCGVCPQWRSVGLMNGMGHKQSLDLLRSSRNKLPMLMIKTEENNNDMRGLYNVSEGTTCNLQLPIPCRNRFIGSSHGWLLCEEGGVISLLNPFTNTTIVLPVFEEIFEEVFEEVSEESMSEDQGDLGRVFFIQKGVLTADPHVSPNNYAILFIYPGYNLVSYKSGDSHWKSFDLPAWEYVFKDVVCYKNELYAVTLSGKLVQVDIDSLSLKTIIKHESKYDFPSFDYLVESRGELLLLKRGFDNFIKDAVDYFADGELVVMDQFDYVSSDLDYMYTITKEFKIFKLAGEKDYEEWVEIDNIGEQALFVGDNHSVSISALEFPGCRSNSIYFTSQFHLDDLRYKCWGPHEDAGFFSLYDNSVHSHHLLDFFEWHMTPSIWFVPNLATSG